MKEEKILTRHPDGKKGVNISKEKYDIVRSAIVDSLREKGELSYTEFRKSFCRMLRSTNSNYEPVLEISSHFRRYFLNFLRFEPPGT